MNSVYDKKIPIFLNYKFLVVTSAIIFPLIFLNMLEMNINIDPLVLFLGLSLIVVVSAFVLKKSCEIPIIPYLFLQLMFLWIFIDQKLLSPVGINLRPHALVLGFSSIVAVYYLFKNFDYLWSNFVIFRYLFVFFIANIIYYFFYHSGFKLSDIKTGYPVAFSSDFGDADASFIVFLNSLGAIVSATLSLSVFQGIKRYSGFQKVLREIILFFSCTTLIYYLASTAYKFDFGVTGAQTFLPMLFFFFLGLRFYLNHSESTYRNGMVGHILSILVAVNAVIMIIPLNKTALIGFGASLLAFVYLNLQSGTRMNIFNENSSKNKIFNVKNLVILSALISFVYIWQSGYLDAIFDKISYFANGFSSMSTLDVRKVNWHYFVVDWKERLNLFNLIFGFGLGASRQSIFYISAMQPSGQLVQTIHNHYMEVLYDYGLISILYFGVFLHTFIDNLKKILNKKSDINIKIFSITSLSILMFFFIYHLTDGIRVPIAIIFFSLLSLLEGIKFSILNRGCNE